VALLVGMLISLPGCRREDRQGDRSAPTTGVEFVGELGESRPVVRVEETLTPPYPEFTPLTRIFEVTASAQPPGEVTIRLPVIKMPDPDGVPLVFAAPTPDGPWEPLPTEPTLVDGKLQARTPHFTFFAGLFASTKSLLAEARRVFDDATGDFVAEADQPTCRGEAEARNRVTVSSSSGSTIKWCLGTEGNDVILRVVNGRRYPLEASHPGLEVIEQSRSLSSFASLARFGSGGMAQLLPREPVVFRLVGERATFQTEFGGAAFGLYQLQVGVELGLAFLTRFGIGTKDTAIKIADTLLMSERCGAMMDEPAGGKILANCFTPKNVLDALGLKALFLAPLMVAGPVISYFQSAFSGGADLISGRDRYSITLSPVPRPTTTRPAPITTQPATSIFDAPLSCAKILSVINSMPSPDRDKIGILAATFVRLFPTSARTLQMVGVPRNSGSGDAYDYRWTTDGGLRFAGPLSDYSIPEKSPFIVRRIASGDFTCEAR
jgi:hypothetical protein